VLQAELWLKLVPTLQDVANEELKALIAETKRASKRSGGGGVDGVEERRRRRKRRKKGQRRITWSKWDVQTTKI
jgi:hypothetical protein